MGCEEHVVGLDGGADEEAGEGDDGEAETFDEVLVDKCLFISSIVKPRKGIMGYGGREIHTFV